MITQAELQKLLSYDPETGIFRWLAPNSNRVCVGDVAGTHNSHGYVQIGINKILHQAHRLAWLYVYGENPPNEVDHINGIKNDNRISNMRLAIRSENGRNVEKHLDNTSGFKGVSWNKRKNRWHTQCMVNGKRHHLGLFLTREEASAAYQTFAKLHHGEFYNSGDSK